MLLYVLSALEGLIMGPLLMAIARGYPYGAQIIGEAALLSAVLVGGLGTYAWISSKDFGYLGRMLFFALIGLIVFGVIGFFVHFGGGTIVIYSLIGTAIFCGFVLYDVSNIKLRYGPDDYVVATLQLYLDFINIFWYVLQLLLALSGGGRRNN
jgi:FtsH-binding integral membrane protein